MLSWCLIKDGTLQFVKKVNIFFNELTNELYLLLVIGIFIIIIVEHGHVATVKGALIRIGPEPYFVLGGYGADDVL